MPGDASVIFAPDSGIANLLSERQQQGDEATAAPGRDSWDFEAGERIGPGRLALKSLGGGSRFDVYLVWDELLFSLAVAKILRPDQAEDERALRELAAEAELLDRLAHPVILRGFDAVLDGPHPHLLIEHLEGPPLRRLIRRGGAAALDQLLPLALHVASAIHYLARMDIVHLDVKPDNIIMGVPPRLIDMSVARTAERAARISGPIGTDAYMAPEQCEPGDQRGTPGPPADVWGLGATLHHAASGRKPFPRERDARESEVPEVRFPQLVEAPRAVPENLPREFAELVAAMLAPEPAERPTAAEVAERLEPLVAALPSKLTVTRTGLKAKS